MGGRVLQGEMMDDPGLDLVEHRHALHGLARINRMSMAAAPVARAMRSLHERLGRAVRVVDVAAGSGDVIIGAARSAGVDTELVLTDISAVALEAAEKRGADAGIAIGTQRMDVLSAALPEGDLVICTLFLHHLDEDGGVRVLSRMRDAAGASVLVSDLRRGVWGTGLSRAVPRMLTRSRVVHVDAVRSARAAWSMGELRTMLELAGMGDARVRAAFPARMLCEWSRAGAS